MNDKSTNFPAIYYNVCVSYPLPDFFEFCLFIDRSRACKFANFHHASLTLFDRYYTLFIWSHFCAFLCRCYCIYCVVLPCHLPACFILHFYDFSVACCNTFPLMCWSVLRFLSLYVILLIVSCYW